MYKLMLLLALSNCSILSFQQMGGTLSYDEEPRVQTNVLILIIERPVAIRHPEQASVISPSISEIVLPQPTAQAATVIAAIHNIRRNTL